MSLELIEDIALENVVENSGGLIRDVLDIMTDGALNAVTEGRTRITSADVEKSALKLKSRYERSLAEAENSDIKVAQYYESLEAIRTSQSKKTLADRALMDLLLTSCVLEYNTERWLDVHPLIARHLDERRTSSGNGQP